MKLENRIEELEQRLNPYQDDSDIFGYSQEKFERVLGDLFEERHNRRPTKDEIENISKDLSDICKKRGNYDEDLDKEIADYVERM